MVFLRKHGLPIPRVYSWSSTPKNPVGTEYIIMEKAQGSPVQKTWYSMTVGDRLQMVEKVVLLEKKLFEISLPACGAIYFKDSLPAGTPIVAIPGFADDKSSNKFCVGPSTEHLWWYSKRDQLGADVGPCEWRTVTEVKYVTLIAHRAGYYTAFASRRQERACMAPEIWPTSLPAKPHLQGTVRPQEIGPCCPN
jgi:hypothetical protein